MFASTYVRIARLVADHGHLQISSLVDLAQCLLRLSEVQITVAYLECHRNARCFTRSMGHEYDITQMILNSVTAFRFGDGEVPLDRGLPDIVVGNKSSYTFGPGSERVPSWRNRGSLTRKAGV